MPARALLSELQLRFNAEELRQLVAARLDADAGTIFGDRATANDAALQLVEWARRHGRLCDLASGAAAERPDNATLQAVARLMPLVCQDRARREWDSPPVDVERAGRVVDPGGEYSNGVQRTLGRLETQLDALRVEVSEMRQELATQRVTAERRYAGQRAQLWLLVVAVGVLLSIARVLAAHAWGM